MGEMAPLIAFKPLHNLILIKYPKKMEWYFLEPEFLFLVIPEILSRESILV